jgi:hypothetical protein
MPGLAQILGSFLPEDVSGSTALFTGKSKTSFRLSESAVSGSPCSNGLSCESHQQMKTFKSPSHPLAFPSKFHPRTSFKSTSFQWEPGEQSDGVDSVEVVRDFPDASSNAKPIAGSRAILENKEEGSTLDLDQGAKGNGEPSGGDAAGLNRN